MITRYDQIRSKDFELHSNPYFRHWRLIHFVKRLTRPFEKQEISAVTGDVWASNGGNSYFSYTPTVNTSKKVKPYYENIRNHSRSIPRNTGRRVF